MPYQKKISILAKNIYVQNYFSPLKLFEYLASGNIIIASKLPVYNHILKNNHNSVLCDPNNPREWSIKLISYYPTLINTDIFLKTHSKQQKNILGLIEPKNFEFCKKN